MNFLSENNKILIKRKFNTRRISIRIKTDGVIHLTYPSKISEKTALKFLILKKEWIQKKLSILEKNRSAKFKNSKTHYRDNRESALRHIETRLENFNKIYNFKYNNVTVKNQRSRWGSCSSKKNLNFNYRIFFIDPLLCDYVIIHELCHLKEMNHSKEFWLLVKKQIPNYLSLRKELKKISLH